MSDSFLDQDAAAFAAPSAPRTPPAPYVFGDNPYARPPRERRRRSILHLLWTLPVAALISVIPYVIAEILLCGIYSCGWSSEPSAFQPFTWILCFGIGAVFAVAVGAVPWTKTREGQTWSAVVAGSIVTIALIVHFYNELY